ncbi:hypothetical protein L484_018003 [Morus notabilis]|uniref:Uncharacterized protein n=1 Tax=Morus notabilis TaxID=981085 RepID=W9RU51_9ROSA|nr:hypothetical protein L484_018003 [Morus notabilis]
MRRFAIKCMLDFKDFIPASTRVFPVFVMILFNNSNSFKSINKNNLNPFIPLIKTTPPPKPKSMKRLAASISKDCLPLKFLT